MSDLHVDLFRVDPFGAQPMRFVRRLALDDPLLVDADGNTTQLQEGRATYYEINQPHTDHTCPVPGDDDVADPPARKEQS